MKTNTQKGEKKVKTIGELPVMKMWSEDNSLFLFVNVRSGIFSIDFPDGHTADFLVDLDKTKLGQKEWTIYKFEGMSHKK